MSTLRGNWSNPELIDIEDIPPPTNITSELISAERVTDSDGMESFMVMMTVNWDVATPTERIKRQIPVRKAGMNLTGYAVVIGFEPIEEPYGEVPMSGSSIQTLMVKEGGRGREGGREGGREWEGKEGVWEGGGGGVRSRVEGGNVMEGRNVIEGERRT